MKTIDARMAKEVLGEKTKEDTPGENRPPELLSTDMEREMMRQKWEEQERELLNKNDIHYEDVLFDGESCFDYIFSYYIYALLLVLERLLAYYLFYYYSEQPDPTSEVNHTSLKQESTFIN